MIVAVHQPNYLPYLGFFHKMSLADVFVLYDTAQFSKNDFHNRNRIKTPQGTTWLTVPVRRGGFRPIAEVEVDDSTAWADRHWETIRTYYARAPAFDAHSEELASIYRRTWSRLAPLNEALLRFFAAALGLQARIVLASSCEIPEGLSASERLAALVRHVGGDVYVSGVGGLQYLDPSAFEDVDVRIQDFRHPEYPQLWGPFVRNLSALDLLLNVGESSENLVRGAGGSKPWPKGSDD